MNIKKYIGIPIVGIIFILMLIYPLWLPPNATISGPNSIFTYQQWNSYINIYNPPDYPTGINIENANNLCLITNNNQTICSIDFYKNGNNFISIFSIPNSNSYTFEYVEFISQNKSEIIKLQKEFILNVISLSSLNNLSPAPENTTLYVENILQNIGVEGAIDSIIPLQYIENVTIIENESYILNNTNLNTENKVKESLESIFKGIIGNNTNILLKPVQLEQQVYIINITTTNNYTLTFTAIKQNNINYNVVIEYIPKLLSYYYNDIILSEGISIQVLNNEPIVEIEPVSGNIEFVVPGNGLNYTQDIGIYYYSIS